MSVVQEGERHGPRAVKMGVDPTSCEGRSHSRKIAKGKMTRQDVVLGNDYRLECRLFQGLLQLLLLELGGVKNQSARSGASMPHLRILRVMDCVLGYGWQEADGW